jgi:flagellar protein FliO/FliZ
LTARARLTTTIVRALLITGALLVAVGPLSAQQAQEQQQAQAPAPVATAPVDTTPLPESGRDGGAASSGVIATGDFVRMVVVLTAVLGAIYLLFRFIRRGAAGRLGNSDLITVLGSRSLGGNRSLHLVRAGRGFYLVGAGDQAVNLVAEITDPDSVDLLAAQGAGPAAAAPNRFADLLAEAGIGTAPEARKSASGHTSFLRQQRDRLRRLSGGRAVEDEARAAP